MNYTTNYHLPQWAESDRIMMEDFNDAMSDIDQGIKTAQDTADTAESKADAAQAAAEAKPYVIGSYSGNGSGKTINLGFKPSAVLISGDRYTDDETEAALSYSVLATDDGPGLVCELTNTGFSVNRLGSYMPFLNDDGRNYRYIAFR